MGNNSKLEKRVTVGNQILPGTENTLQLGLSNFNIAGLLLDSLDDNGYAFFTNEGFQVFWGVAPIVWISVSKC